MSFDIFNHRSKKNLLKNFPRMKLIPAFKSLKHEEADSIIAYVCYMYDMHSPLREYYADLRVRKEEAAELAKLKGKINLEDLYDLKIEEVSAMVNDFLVYQNERVWSMFVSNEQTFYEYQQKLLQSVEGDKDKDILQALQIKSKLMNDMDEINTRLEGYLRRMTGEDNQAIEVIQKRKMITPESIANV